MNQKQRAKWQQTRSKGMWRFVLLYGVLFFGSVMFIVSSVFNIIIGTPAYRNLAITLPIHLVSGLVSGFVFGLVMWLFAEARYRKGNSNS